MCAEFWDGWFDWWGGHHHTTDPTDAAAELESMLAAGASVNFYMFHGGTNFGLTNGANDKGRYHPIVTSYDYDAPLDEAGNPTAKYFAFRDVIARYASVSDELPAAGSPSPQLTVELHPAGDWIAATGGSGIRFDSPPTFDELGFDGGLVRYEVDLPEMSSHQLLEIGEVRDLAWVRVDDGPSTRLSRSRNDRAVAVPPGRLLTVLVEDQGRVNYASRIGEPKGLIGSVQLGAQPLNGWRSTAIDVESIARQIEVADPRAAVGGAQGPLVGPVALTGAFMLDDRSDLFLDTAGWGKGFAFVNGFHLGRYWMEGPQRTLYVPAPVTRAGQNHLVILELEHVASATAHFVPSPLLGHREE
jgi:beta-galactosidase